MRLIAAALFVFIISQTGLAGDLREIELTDGSVITGEVVSLSGGSYMIRSSTLGTVRIDEAKIRAIRSRNPMSSGSRPDSDLSATAASLTEKMMNDGEIMTLIQGLQDDADFKKILADPEILEAVKSYDLETLMSKPEFLKLMDKPVVQNIQEKVK